MHTGHAIQPTSCITSFYLNILRPFFLGPFERVRTRRVPPVEQSSCGILKLPVAGEHFALGKQGVLGNLFLCPPVGAVAVGFLGVVR